MYRLGLKLWSINTNYYHKEAVRLYEKGIFNYIELYIVPNSLEFTSIWKNLEIPFIIHCPHFAHGFNLAKKSKRAYNLEIYKQVKEYADILDAKYIIFHGGIDGNIEETADQLAKFREKRALLENKPFVALPNCMGGNYCRGFNFEEIKIVKDKSNCGFCLDFGHAICAANYQSKRRLSYIAELMRLQPSMFHLTDLREVNSVYDSHLHLGTGQLDIKEIAKFLPKNAIVTIETEKKSKFDLNDFVDDCLFMKNKVMDKNYNLV
jgi:endonuclease IV